MYPVHAAKASKTYFLDQCLVSFIVLATLAAGLPSAWAQDTEAPQPALRVLGLHDCIRIAVQDSRTLMVTDEQRNIASQDVTGAYGQFLPTLSVGYDWRKAERTDKGVEQTSPGYIPIGLEDGSIIGFPASIPNGTYADETIITTYRSIQGQARLNVFSGFSKFSQLSSAKNSLQAAEATRDYTRELVVEDVTAAYFNLLRYQRLLEVALETRDQQQLELERTETYFRLGSAAKSDVLQQRVQVENRKLDVVIADNNVKMAFADLAYLMNHPLADAAGFIIDDSVLDTDFDVPQVEALYTEALATRLDLVSSEHTVEARKKDVTTATAAAWPSLDIFASLDAYENDSPYRFGSQESNSTTFGWTASWNFFDKLQTWTSRSQAKASARISEYQLQQAKLNVQVEIRQLHNSMVEATERAHVSQETIIQAEEELRLASERFRVGAGTTLDIILAQANLADSRAQEVQAICDFLIFQTKMNRAVGRTTGWAAEYQP